MLIIADFMNRVPPCRLAESSVVLLVSVLSYYISIVTLGKWSLSLCEYARTCIYTYICILYQFNYFIETCHA